MIYLRSFFFGFLLPFRALKLVMSKPSLLGLAIFPTLVTLGLYFFLGTQAFLGITWAVSQLALWVGMNPSGWVAGLLSGFLKLFSLLILGLTFSMGASLLMAPVQDFIAERTERFCNPPLEPTTESGWNWRARLIVLDLMKTLASALILLFAFVISFLPLLGLLSALISFLVTAFQYVSYPQTRRGVGFLGGVLFLKKHFFASLGFGMISAVLFSIPLLGAFYLPLAAIGGTLLFAERHRLK